MDGWWYGVVDGRVIKMRQTGDKLEFQSSPEMIGADFVAEYFRLDDNLPLILSQINRDGHIVEAIRALRGLRIVRQEPQECLISYMCATNANIPAIRNMILHLSKRFGRRITLDGHEFYTFPKSSDLAEANIRAMRECKLGFRAERVLEVARRIEGREFDLQALRKMRYEGAKQKLMSLPGVGHKVADCVLLFSLDKLEAFPVDVWIKRITLRLYFDHFDRSFVESLLSKRSLTPREYKKIGSFGREYFGEYAGYAQEYLFHHQRSISNKRMFSNLK